MRSITWRLTLWYTGILMAIIIAFGVSTILGTRYFVYSDISQEMASSLVTVKKYILSQRNVIFYQDINVDDPVLTSLSKNGILWIQITTADGRVLNGSRSLGNTVMAPGYSGPPILTEFRNQQIVLAGSVLQNGVMLQIAFPIVRERQFLDNLAKTLGLLTLAGLVLALAGGWMIAQRALKPIKNLTDTAMRISTTDLSRRIALTGPEDELYVLGKTFNQMLERLEKGFKSQQEFVAAASHDLRTPLTVIKSYTDLLKRWGKDDPAVVDESIQAMGRAVGLMERLVNDLLLLARMQAKPSLDISPLSLSSLAEEITREAQSLSEDISVKLHIKDDISAPADDYYLHRALWSLVDNAIKYGGPGSEVTLTVAAGRDGKTAEITVADNGPGISGADLPKIFDRFYRGDPSRSQKKGFGLGLALAKEIIEAHRGRISVASEEGKGTAFTITLPL